MSAAPPSGQAERFGATSDCVAIDAEKTRGKAHFASGLIQRGAEDASLDLVHDDPVETWDRTAFQPSQQRSKALAYHRGEWKLVGASWECRVHDRAM